MSSSSLYKSAAKRILYVPNMGNCLGLGQFLEVARDDKGSILSTIRFDSLLTAHVVCLEVSSCVYEHF